LFGGNFLGELVIRRSQTGSLSRQGCETSFGCCDLGIKGRYLGINNGFSVSDRLKLVQGRRFSTRGLADLFA
jgi:hypothetical protein